MPTPARPRTATVRRARWALAALLIALLTAGCTAGGTRWHGSAQQTSPSPGATLPGAPAPSPAAGHAPDETFAVGTRTLQLSRGDRQLRTVVWYPAAGPSGRAVTSGAAVASGRYPVLLFSHGLGGDPEFYAPGTTRLAAAGFVVVAPAYPHTSAGSAGFNPVDVLNQPADASAVLDAVLKLDATAGDPFAGHLDAARIGAIGHSAGGYTTTGLFGLARDGRLSAGVVLSGGILGGYQGSPAPILFVHGDRDEVVPYSAGQAAFTSDPWPKAFLTEVGAGHVDYLDAASPGFAPMLATVTDFLRWSLYGDAAAKGRLAADAASGSTRFDARL